MDRRDALLSMLGCGGLGFVFTESAFDQNQQSIQRGRKPVIPQQVIEEFKMQPTEGYGLWVMGEDGKPYSLDEVLLILFTIVKAHWGGDQQRQMASPKRKQ